MTLFHSRQRKILGSILVALQFACMLLLPAMAVPTLAHDGLPWISVALLAASFILILWTLLHNKLGNFNIRPNPKTFGTLVTSGPYRWIRHPMYCAVLLAAAALAVLTPGIAAWMVWTFLAIVLLFKAAIEERWMREQHPEYAQYVRQSTRLIPWIF